VVGGVDTAGGTEVGGGDCDGGEGGGEVVEVVEETGEDALEGNKLMTNLGQRIAVVEDDERGELGRLRHRSRVPIRVAVIAHSTMA
jgi:hypothetical protein